MDNPEQSIKLKDLIFVILRDWRRIILFALVGALLVGAYGFYKNSKLTSAKPASKEPVVLTEKEIEEVKTKLREFDNEYIECRESLEALRSDVRNRNNRLSRSFYLAIDWTAPARAAFDINLTTEKPPEAATESWAERQYLLSIEFLRHTKSDSLYQHIAQSIEEGPTADWVYELITSHRNDNNVIHLEFVAPDEALLSQLVEAAKHYFSYEIREKLSLTYLFYVEIIDCDVIGAIDPGLVNLRGELEEELAEKTRLLEEAEENLALIVEEALEEARLKKQATEDEANASILPKKQSIKKLVLVGAFLGILVSIFWSVIRASSTGVIRDAEHFSNQVGLLFIGTVAAKKEKRDIKMGQSIDDWLENLFYSRTEKGTIGRVVAIVQGLMDDKHKTIAVLADEATDLASTLVEALASESMNGIVSNIQEEEGVKALQRADAAIYIARERETKVRDAMRTLEIASGMGKTILGVIAEE